LVTSSKSKNKVATDQMRQLQPFRLH